MNHPNLYRHSHVIQRFDSKEIIKEFQNKLQWRRDGRDRLLDIGCGPGDTLIDFIYPIMPNNFENITGIDISSNMVNYARELYSQSHPKCTFHVLNIEMDQELPIHFLEQYDHVTSFYCLHWISNLRQAFQNIYKTLRSSGGDCLLVFLVRCVIYDVYLALSKTKKWSKIMFDVNNYITPLYFINEPDAFLADVLKEIGFSDIHIEIRDKHYSFKGLKTLIDNITPVCPFLDRISLQEHEHFFKDSIDVLRSMKLCDNSSNGHDMKITCPYKLAVVYAKKI